MKVFAWFFLFAGFLITLGKATPARVVGGKVQFAVATVNGETVWDETEKQKKIDGYNALPASATVVVSVVTLTPTGQEVMVSTTVSKFENYDDWISYFDSTALAEKQNEADQKAQEENLIKALINKPDE